MDTSLNVKGIQQGLLITLPEGDWSLVSSDMLVAIQERGDFFRGARVALQIGERELSAVDLGHLRDALSDEDVTLWAVLTESEITRRTAADLGLEIKLEKTAREADEAAEPFDTSLPGEEAVLVERTLRSGHSIRYHGHVVVMGDVNPGSEIVAGGHVIIWGKLRGTVHAGAGGDQEATVCALDLAPTQLRIANQISISPKRRGKSRPERAFIKDDQIIAEPWRESDRH
ncbi:MAG: septum site-determining protein MinC [Anaerolineales bacterium]|jgi:septum site-determining protein MinC